MTQDEIIRMALSAGMHYQPRFDAPTGYLFKNREALERFAALVSEATKKKVAKVCEEFKFTNSQTKGLEAIIEMAIEQVGTALAAEIRSMK